MRRRWSSDRERPATHFTHGTTDQDAVVRAHSQVKHRWALNRTSLVDAASNPPLAVSQEPTAEIRAGRSGCRVLEDRVALCEEEAGFDGVRAGRRPDVDQRLSVRPGRELGQSLGSAKAALTS